MNFKFLPHTADLRVRLEGDSLEALFHAGLAAMNQLLKPGFCKRSQDTAAEITHEVEVETADTTVLLVDFLSEVLAFSQADKAIFCRARFTALTPNLLRVTIFGKKTAGFGEDIKAVTYHEAEVLCDPTGRWKTNLVFDI